MYHFSFFGQIFFNWAKIKIKFGKFAIFFADSKSRAQELSNDVSFRLKCFLGIAQNNFQFWPTRNGQKMDLRKFRVTVSEVASFVGLVVNPIWII